MRYEGYGTYTHNVISSQSNDKHTHMYKFTWLCLVAYLHVTHMNTVQLIISWYVYILCYPYIHAHTCQAILKISLRTYLSAKMPSNSLQNSEPVFMYLCSSSNPVPACGWVSEREREREIKIYLAIQHHVESLFCTESHHMLAYCQPSSWHLFLILFSRYKAPSQLHIGRGALENRHTFSLE